MRKIKRWLIEKILPVYLRESLIKENDNLRRQLLDLQVKNKALTAYIDGLEYGVRNQRRITIYNGREDAEHEYVFGCSDR